MEDQDYGENARSDSLVTPQIISSSSINESPNKQVNSSLTPNIIVPNIHSTESSRSFKKILLIMATLVILSSIGFIFFLSLNNNSITDKTYGFKFTNIRNWEKITPRDEAYLSLATVGEKNNIVSYLDVRTLPNEIPEKFYNKMLTTDNSETVSKLCQDTDKEQNISFISIEKYNLPGTNSYKCISEGTGINTDGNILVLNQYIIEKPKYNLIISTSYQKNLPQEAEHVRSIMEGFQIPN